MRPIQLIILTFILFSLPNICFSHKTSTSNQITKEHDFQSPKVVVSITPFYALVAAIMEGIGTPQLLVRSGASPHEYALRFSEIQLLKEADILFWAGPTLETFLKNPLENIIQKHSHLTIVELDKTPGLLLLPLRQDPTWDTDIHSKTHYENVDIDMHFWLDPNNAIILTDNIIKSLTVLDPLHAHLYYQNGKKLKTRLKELDINITTQLKAVRTIPFVVFHDAYQYFEHHYKLRGVGAITLHPEMPPSAKRLSAIRAIIQKTKVRCVFTEPQFHPKLVQSIIQDLQVNSGELDPEGQEAQKNVSGYFELLEKLSNSIKQCLSRNPKTKQ